MADKGGPREIKNWRRWPVGTLWIDIVGNISGTLKQFVLVKCRKNFCAKEQTTKDSRIKFDIGFNDENLDTFISVRTLAVRSSEPVRNEKRSFHRFILTEAGLCGLWTVHFKEEKCFFSSNISLSFINDVWLLLLKLLKPLAVWQ